MAIDAFMDVDAAFAKRKDRGNDSDQDTHHKKSRFDIPAIANTAITPTTSDDANGATAGSSVSNGPRSIATHNAATASSMSSIITRAWAREHNAALNQTVTPSNKLKHRLEDHQEEEPQDHELESWKRHRAENRDRAPSTLSISPTPCSLPSSSFSLSQTSSHRSSSSRSTLQLPISSSSALGAHPSQAPVYTKRALPKPTLMTLRSATRSLRSTPQSSSPTPFTVTTSESVDISSPRYDDNWVKVCETAETMIVTIQTRTKKVTTKTRQEHKESAQEREGEQFISLATLIVDAPKEHMGDERSSHLVGTTMKQSQDVELSKNFKNCNSSDYGKAKEIDESEVDFELDIRGTQKRNNYPMRDRLPRVAGMPSPYQFRLRTLTRLVSAKSNSGKSTEDLYSHHARLVDENVVEGQLDPNHPWAQGPVEFITPWNRRHCHDEYRTSDNHFDHSHHHQSYDDYNSQYTSGTSFHSRIRNTSTLLARYPTYLFRQLPPHMSLTDSLQSYTYSSNYSAGPTHFQNCTTKRYEADENIPPPSFKAPIFDFPSKKRAEPVPLILSTNETSARAFSSSINSSSGTNINTRNHHPLGPNVIEGSDIRISRRPHTNGRYLL
ncbi:MAG: hypothetical protein JOS17DRAFT_816797 [Linnemannia elongata]|nr:MAG: hypothetical protein JOS17DRAFT_816797 [Linnemannia elongata]